MAEVFDFGLQQHKIKMDGKFFESNLFAVAGDTGRRLEVQLLDSNNMIQNTTGISLRLNANVAGQATYAEATLVDATKGLYELDLPNGMLIAPGNWQFQWQIIGASGEKLHSFAFTGSVGSNLSEGGSEATNFYLNVEDLKQMQEDLVNGTFNSEVLETNIAEKLNNLEEQYAPKLTEVTAQLAQMAINVKNHGAVGDWNGVSGTDNLPAFNAAAEALPPSGGYILIPPDEHGGDYMLSNQLRIMKSNVRIIVAAGATIRTVGDQELIVFDDNSEGAEPTLVNCGVIGGGRLYTAKGFARNPIGFVRVKGCYVDGVIVGSGHKGVTAQEYNEDINFSNIHIEYADTAGITLESGINGAMIDKITIDECGKGVHVTGGDVGATGVSIDNVNIKKGTGDGIHCSKVVDLSMGDNIIANVDGRGIVTDNCTKIQENDNILKNIGQHGIANLNPSGELHADSNQLTNVGLAAPNTYDGFYTSGATQKYTYSNNDLAGTAHRAAVNNANMVAGLGIFRGNKLERGLSDNPNMYYGWTPYFIDDIVNGVKLYLENGLRTLKGVSAPTSGPWIKGDKIVNTTHSAVKNINEWVCNSSGTPGAWIARGLGSGPSSIRPTDLTQNDTGYAYFDTTLKKTIVWSGSNWIE